MLTPNELLKLNHIELQDTRCGRHYTTCPQCSAKRSAQNQKHKCLGVTIEADGSVRWGCNHCGWTGPQKGGGFGGEDGRTFYFYRDTNGTVRFRKVRNLPYRTPRFSLECPDDSGGWLKGTKGVDTTILYRADEVARAIADDIAVVEGEIASSCAGLASSSSTTMIQRAMRMRTLSANCLAVPPSAYDGSISKTSGSRYRRAATYPTGSPGEHTAQRLKALIEATPEYADAEIPASSEAGSPPTEIDHPEIERLTKLSKLQYEKERPAAAKKLGVRVTVLDELVDAARAKLYPDPEDDGEQRRKAADILIELSAGAEELFHAPDGTAYATIPVGDHLETWAIGSKGLRQWLARQFFVTTSSAPNSDALQAALNVIAAQARFDCAQRPVYVRVATHDGRLYLDLADEKWRVVEISSTGWQIVNNPPVRFRRAAGLLPLPEPVRGGKIEEMRPFFNVGDDNEFVLTVCFSVATFREGVPYPVLALSGEHGSAKSTFARVLRKLIDPNSAPLRSLPREDRDLFIAAKNGYLLVFDNISKLFDWLSDALSRLSTGGRFSTRELIPIMPRCYSMLFVQLF